VCLHGGWFVSVVICPGFHPPELTQGFLTGLGRHQQYDIVFPTDQYPPYSCFHLLDFLRQQLGNPVRGDQSFQPMLQMPLLFIGFSAGVIAAIGAAWAWQLMGGQVRALIAVDGWGMPLYGDFPIHRVSHDYFTHWSSTLFGGGRDSFYADPAVPHLDLWRSPQAVQGYWRHCPVYSSNSHSIPMTAADFLRSLLSQYGEAATFSQRMHVGDVL